MQSIPHVDKRPDLKIVLKDDEDTLRLGRIMAQALTGSSPPSLLLQGELGAGKTTFTRGLVTALPGGEDAEVSSPSFNLVNIYPTQPETAHFDLYRLIGPEPDDDLLECMHSGSFLVIVEWSERLAPAYLPAEYVRLTFTICDQGRAAVMEAHGFVAHRFFDVIEPKIKQSFKES